MLNRTLPVLILALLPALAYSGEVKLLTWEAYLSDKVVHAFRLETGHRVEQFFISSDSERNAMFDAGGATLFDLVMADNGATQAYAKQGLIQKMTGVVSSLAHIDADWQQACGEFGAAYSWGTLGIAYRQSFGIQIDSWQQLFVPPAPFQGKVVTMTDSKEFTAAALMAHSFSPNSSDPRELQRAFELMRAQRQHVLAYDYGVSYALSWQKESEMAMALAYSADVEEIISATGQKDWTYVVPNEGTLLWVDCWVIPSGRAVNKATLAFLEFINRPEIAALNAEQAWFPSPIGAARKLTSDAHKGNTELYPGTEVMKRSVLLYDRPEEAKRRISAVIDNLKNQ
ncbi:polyamine ABC transporter substrate-binding protein [Ferrimonas futtsuensis]|uniref:polyamine ABC transporter substrate-binding protein n=1 Tax=Ferrimonas futtsuensis TaxID=364764 RepID=UPI000A00C59F|nr:spermidine/putrescine ABC transporter substrate-binding protein [Ferrimonas futtsuensis]